MHRGPLHRHIAPVHQLRFPRIQHQLNAPLQHHAVIQALRSMHHAVETRREVDDSADGAAGIYEPEFAGGQEGVVGCDVGVGIEGGWEAGGGVDYVEAHEGIVVGTPIAGAGGLDYCLPGRRVVASDIAR